MPVPNTRSTGWPESPAREREAQSAAPDAEAPPDTAQLGLLLDLEASLRASQQATLARDLEGLERLTADQARLRRALADMAKTGSAGDAAVWAAQDRVLHQGRVQLFLLAFARRRLHMLAHVRAGCEAWYAPGPRTWAASPPSPGSEEPHLCRV